MSKRIGRYIPCEQSLLHQPAGGVALMNLMNDLGTSLSVAAIAPSEGETPARVQFVRSWV